MTHHAEEWAKIPVVFYVDAVQDGQAPLFVAELVVEGVKSCVLKRADGTLVRVEVNAPIAKDVVQGEPTHTREYLRKWIDKIAQGHRFPLRLIEFKRRLLSDFRMREFWDWFENLEQKRAKSLYSSVYVAELMWRSKRLPGKPGNMTPKQRTAYFEAVRKHAEALAYLLMDTIFEDAPERELSDGDLSKTMGTTLRSWGDDEQEPGHIVAYRVSVEGVFEQHYDYPRCTLVASLWDLHEWTYWDDQWDGSIFGGSSAPIAQANSKSTPIVYFTCTFYTELSRQGIEIPFPILATVANVALDLSDQDAVDEDTVRRQVRRFQERMAEKERAARESGLGGQNFPDDDISVLLDPF